MEGIPDSYQLGDFQNLDELDNWLIDNDISGFNVTIPYKEKIISKLDSYVAESQEIGAVNCVKIEKGKRVGYNTDAYGFQKSLEPMLPQENIKALIFGDGGAAKAIKYVLKKLGITFQVVSRKGELQFSDLTKAMLQSHLLWVNTTPVGTYPNVSEKLDLDYEAITNQHLVYDLVYNPEKTHLLQSAEKRGEKIKNGYEMLVLQAEKSYEIWNS